jgi:glycosyltransferase involved in cell wall biosynthesis
LRLLVATPFLPHPSADHGGGVYLAALLRAMAMRCEMDLVSMCRPSEAAMGRELRWFAHVDTVPVPRSADRGHAGRALDHLRHGYLWGARGLPLLAAKMQRGAMHSALERALARRPDAALLEFAVMAQYLPRLHGRCATVLTDHERGGHTATGIFGRNLGRGRDERLWRRYVRRYYPLATQLQAVNTEDARILGRTLHRMVTVRPLLVDLPPRPVDVAVSPARAVFLGDYSHHPNTEAATFVATKVWPQVRATAPHAELWLAGARANRSVRQLEQVAGVRYVGFVRDLAQLFADVRLLLAPVLSGEGSRVKVITAAAHGVPVVANALALSGLGLPASAARTGESVADLAAHAHAWLHDPVAAGHAGAAARAWAEASLLPDTVVEGQLESLRALLHAWPRS